MSQYPPMKSTIRRDQALVSSTMVRDIEIHVFRYFLNNDQHQPHLQEPASAVELRLVVPKAIQRYVEEGTYRDSQHECPI